MIQNPPTRDLPGKARDRTKKKKLSTCSKPEVLKPEKLLEAKVKKVRGSSRGETKRRLKLMYQMYRETQDRRTYQWHPGCLCL